MLMPSPNNKDSTALGILTNVGVDVYMRRALIFQGLFPKGHDPFHDKPIAIEILQVFFP